MKFETYNENNAPEATRSTLAAVKEKYTFLPNLMGALAESKPVLDSYLQLGEKLSESTLTDEEIQVLYLATNYENGCTYCMAAHSTVATMMNMPSHILESLRAGKTLDNPKLDALANFTRSVVDKRGWLDNSDTEKFLAAGYTKANVLDVILGVAHKTISNYVNHINETELDAAFAPQKWSK